MNKLKFLSLVACICMVTVVLSCNKDEDKPGSCPVSSINATVVSNSSFNSKIDAVKVVVNPDVHYDEENGPIITGGALIETSNYVDRLSLNLPDDIPNIYLESIFNDSPNGVKISNKNVKGTTAFLLGCKSESEVGYFLYIKLDNKGYNYVLVAFADLWFVNNDVIITGSNSYKDGNDSYIQKFNVSLKKGWNYMFTSEDVSKDGKTITYNYTTSNPGGMMWYFFDYGFDLEPESAIQFRKPSLFNLK